jgi:hypothetical protein
LQRSVSNFANRPAEIIHTNVEVAPAPAHPVHAGGSSGSPTPTIVPSGFIAI